MKPNTTLESIGANTKPVKTKINCDQVAWLIGVLDRYAEVVRTPKPAISRADKGAKTAAILEIMDILYLDFLDRSARHNTISHFGELYQNTDESPA